MRIKAVVFDIGQTLVHYPIPLNWSALYRPAFEHIEQKLGLNLSEVERMTFDQMMEAVGYIDMTHDYRDAWDEYYKMQRTAVSNGSK